MPWVKVVGAPPKPTATLAQRQLHLSIDRLVLRNWKLPDQRWMTLLHRYLASSYIKMSAISQNRPRRVEIKGFKTSHSLGVKTALIGPITAGREYMSNLLRVSLQTTIHSLRRSRMGLRSNYKQLGR